MASAADDDLSKRMKNAIQEVIIELMEKVMDKVLKTDPFVTELHHASRPIYAALVPDEIFKGSHFERRFVTPFGGVWEQLAVVAATNGLGYGIRGQRIEGMIQTGRLQRIQEVLNNLEHTQKGETRKKPNWSEELQYIRAGKGNLIPTIVECDVYAEDTINNLRFAFELKAPLPNSDITKVSKEKLFKLYCMEPMQITSAYYALPYNPYGKRENYSWSFPARWFDMQHDESVLIGDEFWDKIGGKGTYNAFITAINEIGPEYKARIYKEYLGIIPPEDIQSGALS